MTSKLIVVVGATGGQGGAVVQAFLGKPNWRVRGITRNPSSKSAKALSAKGVEMVKADISDLASVAKAFQGAHVIFAITDYYAQFFTEGFEKSMEIEYRQGTNMAKAASQVPTLEHYIWSTLPYSSKVTDGAVLVPHFEAKARVDEFIKQDQALLEKTTFCFFTTFIVNLFTYELFRPVYLSAADKWIQFYPAPPQAGYPCLGDHRTNTGIFVHALVQNKPPGGTYVKCSVEDLTLESYLALWGRVSGIAPGPDATQVIQVSPETYVKLFGPMGEEQAKQWALSRFILEHGPKGGISLDLYKDAQQFMSKDEISSLKSVEESLKDVDWKAHGF